MTFCHPDSKLQPCSNTSCNSISEIELRSCQSTPESLVKVFSCLFVLKKNIAAGTREFQAMHTESQELSHHRVNETSICT